MNTTLIALYVSVSQQLGLPPGLLSAVCYVESHHRVDSVHHHDGGSRSVGVCQIKLDTARLLGFHGSEASLYEPRNNIYYAGKYLTWQMDRYDRDPVSAVAAYNRGTERLNRKGIPVNEQYVEKVFDAWFEGL